MNQTPQPFEEQVTTEFNRITGIEVMPIYNIPTAVGHIVAAHRAEQVALLSRVYTVIPEANPKEWADNKSQLAWTIGYEKAVKDFKAALDKLKTELEGGRDDR